MSRAIVRQLLDAAIDAVKGERVVADACSALPGFRPGQIVAVGKAASEMLQGALRVYGQVPSLLITKYGHLDSHIKALSFVESIEAGHPIPDVQSIDAGKRLLETVKHCNSPLLVLISGGASALAEQLAAGTDLSQWQAENARLIASGLDIAAINQWRKSVSTIKAGKLLAQYRGPEVVSLAISDVKGDDISVIGSGLADTRLCQSTHSVQIVADNRLARQGAQQQANALGLNVVVNEPCLYGEVGELAERLAQRLIGGPGGVYILGGEPTITLPSEPGNGGRNQSLALAVAQHISGVAGITVVVAGTDGSDGPTDATGAIVDGGSFTCRPGAPAALVNADAGTFLRLTGDILITGPSGTNVADLLIAVKA